MQRARLLSLKNAMDRSLAGAGLLAFSPLMLSLACLIRLRMGSPVLVRQIRIGYRGRQFRFLKFRTMTNARDSFGRLLPDERRLTPLGRFLRASSLDELPQMWNVLKGEMSLVGPRPLLPEYLPRYNARQRRRHDIKPGITGWAQVNGRASLPWSERIELDLYYIEHRSLSLDLQILRRTVAIVLGGSGTYKGAAGGWEGKL